VYPLRVLGWRSRTYRGPDSLAKALRLLGRHGAQVVLGPAPTEVWWRTGTTILEDDLLWSRGSAGGFPVRGDLVRVGSGVDEGAVGELESVWVGDLGVVRLRLRSAEVRVLAPLSWLEPFEGRDWFPWPSAS